MNQNNSFGNEPFNKKTREELDIFETLGSFARIFGFLSEQTKSIKDIKECYGKIVSNIDCFNKYFGPLGWVATGSFNSIIAEEAIRLYEKNKVSDAEELLCSEVEKMIDRFQKTLKSIKAFEVRSSLLNKAIIDHFEARYHASIPVILSCVDGIVNDVSLEQKGLYAEGDHLKIPNSIVGYIGGLTNLMKLICKKRGKTNIEKIQIPFRNGILHGRDINYDNKISSCKCLGLLIAIRDWSSDMNKKIEEDKQELKKEPTLMDSLRKMNQIEENKKKMAKWKKRDAKDIDKINLAEGTPEESIMKQFEFWKANNYGNLARGVSLKFNGGKTHSQYAGHLAKELKVLKPIGLVIDDVEDKGCGMTHVKYTITASTRDGKIINKSISHNVLYENELGEPMSSNIEGGVWKSVFGRDLYLAEYLVV